MQPESVLNALAQRSQARAKGQDTEVLETSESAETGDGGSLYDHISASYRQLRLGMALLAILLPVLLIFLGGLDQVLNSLSAYYHSSRALLRDVFVGTLWAVGAFLVFYKGYTRRENWALNVAGVSATFVSLFPTDCQKQPGQTCADEVFAASATIHGLAAVVFFTLIGYVCVCRSRDTLTLMTDEARRAMFRKAYWALGVVMVLTPLVGIAIKLGDHDAAEKWILIVEVVGIYVFAAFWALKSYEIRLIEGQGG